MAATVSEVLAERAHAGDPPRMAAAGLSLTAHLLFIGLLAVISRPRPLAIVPAAFPVRVVSPSWLQRPGPPAAAPAAPAAPSAPAAPPTAAPREKARPAIESTKEKPRPSEKAMPLPAARNKERRPLPKAAPATSAAGAPAASPALDLPSAGGAGGEAGTNLSFGAAVSSFDADFPFAYYVEQLQSLIGANWLKPNVAERTSAVIAFRILRSGQVTDVKIEAPSGIPVYDRAATRAVYAANPLPPLPPEYRGDALGVHIRFQ